MSPAPQLLDPDLVAISAQAKPVPLRPHQRHHVGRIASQQPGNARFGGRLAGLLTS